MPQKNTWKTAVATLISINLKPLKPATVNGTVGFPGLFESRVWLKTLGNFHLTMQVSDYKDEIDRLNRELQDVKKKFYDQKKREMIQQDQKKGER